MFLSSSKLDGHESSTVFAVPGTYYLLCYSALAGIQRLLSAHVLRFLSNTHVVQPLIQGLHADTGDVPSLCFRLLRRFTAPFPVCVRAWNITLSLNKMFPFAGWYRSCMWALQDASDTGSSHQEHTTPFHFFFLLFPLSTISLSSIGCSLERPENPGGRNRAGCWDAGVAQGFGTGIWPPAAC